MTVDYGRSICKDRSICKERTNRQGQTWPEGSCSHVLAMEATMFKIGCSLIIVVAVVLGTCYFVMSAIMSVPPPTNALSGPTYSAVAPYRQA
jgi:hypothetical protein